MPIKQLPWPCWVRKEDPDGSHWPSRENALEHAERDEIAQQATLCWVACCACGAPLGDDQFSQLHFDDRASLIAEARDCGWTLVGDDLRCEDDTVTADA